VKKTIVAFAAHPDDLEFSSTGMLYKFKREGYRLIYVIVTNGENGFKMKKEVKRKERIKIRQKEQLEVGKKLGVKDIIFFNYRDGRLIYDEKLRQRLVKIIKKYKPQIVFAFDPANREFDNINLFHHDHRIVGEAVFDAVFAAKNKFMYEGESHKVAQIYFYGTYKPTHFEDITDILDFKFELLACHRSQFPDFSVIKDFVRDMVLKKTEDGRISEYFRVLDVQPLTDKKK